MNEQSPPSTTGVSGVERAARRGRSWAWACVAAPLAFATACSSSSSGSADGGRVAPSDARADRASDARSGVDDAGSPTDASASCFADGDLANKCFTCTDTYCCPSQEAFLASDGGPAYQSCFVACGNSAACTLKCAQSNPEGFAITAPYEACSQRNCGGPCGGATDPCTACMDTSCAVAEYACNADPGCALLSLCLEVCNDVEAGTVPAGCSNACYEGATQASLQLFYAQQGCTLASCATDCNTVTSCNLPVIDQACASCQAQHCCAEALACSADPTCGAVIACSEQCSSASCATACDTALDGGLNKALDALLLCWKSGGCTGCL